MCFGKKPSTPRPADPVVPAPAPEPAEPMPEETEIGAKRSAEEEAMFGERGPTTRVDRSSQAGLTGGTGVNI